MGSGATVPGAANSGVGVDDDAAPTRALHRLRWRVWVSHQGYPPYLQCT